MHTFQPRLQHGKLPSSFTSAPQIHSSRDLFLSSTSDARQAVQQQAAFKAQSRTSSHHPEPYDNRDHDWNIDDDIQPLNITDSDVLEHRPAADDERDDSYLTAYHQLLQTQQQIMMIQSDQENMLSTILEASCEEATPMTSLIDVHQPAHEPTPTYESDDERPIASLDDVPVSTVFSKNEGKPHRSSIPTRPTSPLPRLEIHRLHSPEAPTRGRLSSSSSPCFSRLKIERAAHILLSDKASSLREKKKERGEEKKE